MVQTSSPETTGPIEAKFHVGLPWDRETKVHSNGRSHMTKMATMPIIYLVKTLKNLPRTKRPMTLKLCMQYRVLEYHQVCSNDAPGLTLTYFTTSLYGKKLKQRILQKLL